MFSDLITPFAQNLSANLLKIKYRAFACSIYTIAYFDGSGLYLNQYQVPVDVFSLILLLQDPNETYPCDPDLDDIMALKTEEEKRKSIKVCTKTSDGIKKGNTNVRL